MKTICIVPCGIKKIWDKYQDAGPTPARDVYIGSFARKCQEYAQVFYPNSYFILSAKYGFLHPSDIIPEDYDVSFKKPKSNPITIPVLLKVAMEKGISDANCIIVVAGRDYSDIVCQVFPDREIVEPLKGCKGNGFMMQRINKAIESGMPIISCE